MVNNTEKQLLRVGVDWKYHMNLKEYLTDPPVSDTGDKILTSFSKSDNEVQSAVNSVVIFS